MQIYVMRFAICDRSFSQENGTFNAGRTNTEVRPRDWHQSADAGQRGFPAPALSPFDPADGPVVNYRGRSGEPVSRGFRMEKA